MKPLTPRERVLVAALPATLILMVYYFFFARPMAAETADLRRQIGAAEARSPDPQRRAEVLRDLAQLEAEVREREALAKERRERAESLRAYWSDPDAKRRAGEFLGDLLAERGLVLVEEAVATGPERAPYESLLATLPGAELWRLRLAGSYLQVAGALETLGASDLPLVPAALEMEPRVEGNRTIHLWSLWICR